MTTNEIEGKVTGTCEFTSDIQLPGMLIAQALYPEHPRAKIKKLDISASEAIPGVGAIVTYHDLPDKTHYGILIKDQQIFAMGEVYYIGDIVALVAAETKEIAQQAEGYRREDLDENQRTIAQCVGQSGNWPHCGRA